MPQDQLQEKCRAPRTPVLRQPAHSKYTWTSHKSLFMQEEKSLRRLCASLHSRNSHWKMTGLESVPWSNPGLKPYRKNPSVWTQCLGNKMVALRSSEFKVNALKYYLKMMFNFNWGNISALQRINGCCTKFRPMWGICMVRMLQFMFRCFGCLGGEIVLQFSWCLCNKILP